MESPPPPDEPKAAFPEPDSDSDDQNGSNRKIVLTNAIGYCENTTVHGFSYLPAGRNWCERIFWGCIILIGFTCASIIINTAYSNWQANPTITTTTSYNYDVTNMDFPTITICPEQHYDRFGMVRMLLNTLDFACKFEQTPEPSDVEYDEWLSFNDPTDYEYDVWAGEENKVTEYDYWDMSTFNTSMSNMAKATDCSRSQALRNSSEWKSFLDDLEEWGPNPGYSYEGNISKTEKRFKHLMKAFAYIESVLGQELPEVENIVRERAVGKLQRFPHVSFNYSEPFNSSFNGCWEWNQCKSEGYNKSDMAYDQLYFSGRGTEDFGSLFQNYGSDQYSRSIWTYSEGPHYKNQLGEEEMGVFKYFEELLNGLAGEELGLEISLHDVPAILVPHDNYKNKLEFNSAFSYSYQLAWNKMNTSAHNCSMRSKEFMKCLGQINYFGLKLGPYTDLVLKSMRLSQVLASTMLTNQQFNDIVGDLEYMKFDRRIEVPARPVEETMERKLTSTGGLVPMTQWEKDSSRLELILDCQYPTHHGMDNCRDLFTHTPTHRGICSVFNGAPLEEVMDFTTPWMKSFDQYYNSNPIGTKLEKTFGAGLGYAVSFLLDMHNRNIFNASGQYFHINLNYKYDFFDMGSESVHVQPGRQVEIKLEAAKHEPTDSFKDLPLEERECKRTHEINEPEKSIFNLYTKRSCLFECAIHHVREKCGCQPWDIPQRGDIEEICDGYGAECFYKEMFNSSISVGCDCPPDCTTTSYFTVLNTYMMDPTFICDFYRAETMEQLLEPTDSFAFRYRDMDDKIDNVPEEKVLHSEWLDNRAIRQELCKQKVVDDLAFIKIMLASPEITIIAPDVRMTFVDQIGMLGGTIGLFTGLSLISLVEVCFWLFRLAKDLFKLHKGKISRKELKDES